MDDALVVKRFEGAPFRPGPVSYAAAIARAGSRLAVVSGLGLALFDGDGALVATRPIDPSSSVSFGASGALLLASDVYSGVVGVFDASTLERRATIAPPKPFATDVFPSPTHAHLVLFAWGEFATVWNIETGVIERELPLYDGSTPRYTSDACFSPDGTSVAVVESGALSVWDLRTGEQRARCALSATVLRIASARDGARWFGASSDGRLLAIDARSCELVADADGTIRVFDVERAFGATKVKKSAKKKAKSCCVSSRRQRIEPRALQRRGPREALARTRSARARAPLRVARSSRQ